MAREMTGQGLTLWLAFWRCGLICICIVWRGLLRGRGNLFVFQCQRQLVQGFRAGPEANWCLSFSIRMSRDFGSDASDDTRPFKAVGSFGRFLASSSMTVIYQIRSRIGIPKRLTNWSSPREVVHPYS